MRVGILASAALLAAIALPAQGCEPPALSGPAQTVEGERHVLAFATEPATPRVGEFFVVKLSVCRRDGKPVGETAVDAVMPEHRHGMNFRPVGTSSGPGRYRVEGLMFHMPGLWRFLFEVRGEGGERLQSDVRLR